MPLKRFALAASLLGAVYFAKGQPEPKRNFRCSGYLNKCLARVRDTISPRYRLIFWNDQVNLTKVNVKIDGTDREIVKKICSQTLFKDSLYFVGRDAYIAIKPDYTRLFIGKVFPKPKDDTPLPGRVFVKVLRTGDSVEVNAEGQFVLSNVVEADKLLIYGKHVVRQRFAILGRLQASFDIELKDVTLPAAFVSIQKPDNGLNDISGDIPTSFSNVVQRATLEQYNSSTAIEGLVLGGKVLRTGASAQNSLGIALRGVNSFISSRSPLLIVDDFIWPGLESDINPNDIGFVSILNDASGASLWGTVSANGVLVYGPKPDQKGWTFNGSQTLVQRPDLSSLHWMKPGDFIDAEKQFYNKGLYDGTLANPNFPITPALEILQKQGSGLSATDAGTQLATLGTHNVLDDLRKYFYQPAFAQQYYISNSDHFKNRGYDLSFGFDRDETTLRRNEWQRITAKATYIERSLKNLQSILQLSFSNTGTVNTNGGTSPVGYTYARLADAQGRPLTVPYAYNPHFVDSMNGLGILPNWNYSPLQELDFAHQKTNRNVYNAQLSLSWDPYAWLKATVRYRYFLARSGDHHGYDQQDFYTRNLYNEFAQISAGKFYDPITLGSISQISDTTYHAQNLRAQISFHNPHDSANKWMLFAGWEARTQAIKQSGHTTYLDDQGAPVAMDFANSYPALPNDQLLQIPGSEKDASLATRYLSFFGNGYFSWKDRYTISGSFRRDASNFVGVAYPQKWANFGALGVSAQVLHRADSVNPYPNQLIARANYGVLGNIGDRNTLLTTERLANNAFGNPQSGITNPPATSPAWERINMLSLGFSFNFFRDKADTQGRFFGYIDYYQKDANQLLAYDSLPLSAGFPMVLASNGQIKGHGLEMDVQYKLGIGQFKWKTGLNLNYNHDVVSHYASTAQAPGSYVNGLFPMVGRSPAGLFAYKAARLDSTTGDPRGYLYGKLSKDYNALMTDAGGALHYIGSYQPVVFGAWINTVDYKKWQLLTIVNYKLGYWLRKGSINYEDIIKETGHGNDDYAKRWQKPGDEQKTTVPSLPQQDDPNRNTFYLNSDVNVVKGDHIGLQLIQVSKALGDPDVGKWGCRVSFTVTNPWIIWRANKLGLNPDALEFNQLPARPSFTLGFKMHF